MKHTDVSGNILIIKMFHSLPWFKLGMLMTVIQFRQ